MFESDSSPILYICSIGTEDSTYSCAYVDIFSFSLFSSPRRAFRWVLRCPSKAQIECSKWHFPMGRGHGDGLFYFDRYEPIEKNSESFKRGSMRASNMVILSNFWPIIFIIGNESPCVETYKSKVSDFFIVPFKSYELNMEEVSPNMTSIIHVKYFDNFS